VHELPFPNPLRELHLFAGAGGGILGGMLLGHTCVCAVEIIEYRRKTLLQRQRDGILPRFPIWDDISTFDGKPWRNKVEVVCGGFPCQDISIANPNAEGITGSRSGLWSEMSRVVCEVGPRYVFVENSAALVIRGLGRVLGDLAKMGYDARWGVFSAGDVGARHERERLWILASNDWEKRVQRIEQGSLQRFSSFPWGEDVRGIEDMRKRPDIHASGLCRGSNGVANYVDRISAIGDGQVPRVAAHAWRTLTANLNITP